MNGTKDSGKNVLCLYTCRRYDKIVQFSLSYLSDQDHVVSFRRELQDCKVEGGLDFLKAAQACAMCIEKNSVDAVLVLDDDTAPIFSMLVEKYGKSERAFRGPSFESLYLTITSSTRVNCLTPILYRTVISIWTTFQQRINWRNAINEVGLPAILKPTCGGGSLLIQKVNSLQDLGEAIKHAKKQYGSRMGNYTPLISRHLDVKKFPASLTDGMILEKYVDGDIFDLDG